MSVDVGEKQILLLSSKGSWYFARALKDSLKRVGVEGLSFFKIVYELYSGYSSYSERSIK
jgi:hypothetical protein